MKELVEKIVAFRNDRDWKQFHNPKDLTISLTLEASELLENFQWKSSQEAIKENIDNIKEELADVIIYSLLLANDLNLDINEIVENKILQNERKYPVDKSLGSKKKYTKL